jgi:gamma-glutamylcyclotransferase (GGCT)/AIG2-like uncharacterized protein YtfP
MKSRPITHLFAYGTLMCADIMGEVSGWTMSAVPATLWGYRRLRVKGEQYPALVRDAQGHVQGVVYRNVPAWAWVRLDHFEGEMYSREIVQVELTDATLVSATTYVVRAEFRDCLDNTDWDLAVFLRDGKESFRRGYKGYRALTGGDRTRPLDGTA